MPRSSWRGAEETVAASELGARKIASKDQPVTIVMKYIEN